MGKPPVRKRIRRRAMRFALRVARGSYKKFTGRRSPTGKQLWGIAKRMFGKLDAHAIKEIDREVRDSGAKGPEEIRPAFFEKLDDKLQQMQASMVRDFALSTATKYSMNALGIKKNRPETSRLVERAIKRILQKIEAGTADTPAGRKDFIVNQVALELVYSHGREKAKKLAALTVEKYFFIANTLTEQIGILKKMKGRQRGWLSEEDRIKLLEAIKRGRG